MKNKHAARVIAIFIALLTFLSLPEIVQSAEAYPYVKYTITYKITVKTKTKSTAPFLSKKKVSFTKGEIRSIRLYNASAKKVRWYSSNKRVATVKKSGKWCNIKAKKPGKVIITAKYNGKSYRCKVTIKKKKKTAFKCYTNKNGETLRFRTGKGDNENKKEWYMYDSYYSNWYSVYDMDIGFETKVYPVSLKYKIGNSKIIRADWDYDEDLGWLLMFYPKKEGQTYLTITNSYNSQSMRFPIVVEDNYVIPSKRVFELEEYNYDITKLGDCAVIKVLCSKDVSDINCYYDNNDAGCKLIKKVKENGYYLLYIQPTRNGTSKIVIRDTNNESRSLQAEITAKMPNGVISTDKDAITMNLGETKNLVVSTDFSHDIVAETNPDILTLNYKGVINGGNTYNYEITARNGGDTEVVFTDKYDSSVRKTVSVNVYDPESKINYISCGRDYTAILREDGSLHMTGKNNYGQLGNGTTEDVSSFVKIADGVKSVSCGDFHTGILKQDGSLWMCGYNYCGQFGNGQYGAYMTTNTKPVQIMDGVIQVSCGGNHTGILKEDGSLWMCGNNHKGALGNGTNSDISNPVKIMDGVVQVSCGGSHTGILKEDGSLWMCGWNENGQLGDGTQTDRTTPVKIMDGVAQVNCGYQHTGIIKQDGSLWMCGDNLYGQLGDGTETDKSTPVKIMNGVSLVDCGGTYMGSITGIVKNDSSLWMCGENNFGQLGDDTTITRTTPVKVMDGVVQVSCGYIHSGILKNGGILNMCGYELDGQLGESRYHRPIINTD